MTNPLEPINVTPLDSSNNSQQASSARSFESTPNPIPTNSYYVDPPRVEPKQTTSRAGSAITMAVGGAVALVGIPLLILPGPGLLAIGGGAFLMAKGAKGLFGNKKSS